MATENEDQTGTTSTPAAPAATPAAAAPAATDPPAPEPVQTEDDFADEFSKIVAASSAPADKKDEPAKPAAKPADDKPAAAAPAAKPADDKPAAPAPDKPAAAAPAMKPAEAPATTPTAPPAPAAPAAPATPPVAPAAAPAAPAAPTAPAPDKPAEPPKFEIADPVLTEEQTQKLEEFKKAWPDVHEAYEIQRQHDMKALGVQFSRTLYQVVQRIYSDFAPVVSSVATTEQNLFRKTVVEAHADFDAVKPQLATWIDQQPAYLRDAYKRVHDEGSAEEVVDLVNRFKESTGVKPKTPDSSPQPPNTPPTEPKKEAPGDPAKAAALTPVEAGKRSTPATRGLDPNDFDGAFAEAVAAAVAEVTPTKR